MKEKLILFVKGFIIGIGKIIPGVSGGMLAISMKIYDKGIDAIANFFSEPRKHLSFLVTIGLGIGVAMLIGSNVVLFLLEKFYLPTMLLFIGLICGGMAPIYYSSNLKKNYLWAFIPIILMIILSVSSSVTVERIVNANFLSLFLVGSVEAFAMVVPGVSGTAFMMILGYYELIMKAYSTIDFKTLIPFLWGTGMFIFILVRIVDYMLSNHSEKSYSIIFGFAVSSICILFCSTLQNNYSFGNIVVGLFSLLIGYICSRLLDNL